MSNIKSDLLQVYIITENAKYPNENYVRMFARETGFAKPIFVEKKYPNKEWLKQFCKYMTKNELIELYNHYLIWLKAQNENKPQVILYNDSYTTQSDSIVCELIRAGVSIQNEDIVFYGKHLDQCDKYKYDCTVAIRSDTNISNFSLYKTFNAYGFYAYLINPSGAAILINELTQNPAAVEIMIHKLLKKNILEAVTYHPSIIRLINSKNECKELDNRIDWGMLFWYIIIFILIGLIIGVFIYLIAIRYIPELVDTF